MSTKKNREKKRPEARGGIVKKAQRILSYFLVAGLVLLAAALAGGRLLGFHVFAVLSGSMEPSYHTGSLIYTRKVDPAALKAGDVITFHLDGGSVATHRIVEVVPDKEDPSVIRFRTKGDANETEDGSLVHCKNVVGAPVFTVPYLGYVANTIRNPPGIYAAAAVCGVLLFLPDILAGGRERGEKGRTAPARRKKDGRYVK